MRTGASIFLRADGRWEARYQKSRDENGKIVYGFVYGATREEAERKRAAALRESHPDADSSTSVLPSLNPRLSSLADKPSEKTAPVHEKVFPAYDDRDAAVIHACLEASGETSAVGFYLCLHMGLSLSEILALRYGDIDMPAGEVHVRSGLKFTKDSRVEADTNARSLRISPGVREFLQAHRVEDKSPAHFVLTDDANGMTSKQSVGAALRRIVKGKIDITGQHINRLRSTFIRRCLESNMNIETVSLLTGLSKALLYRYYGIYIQADPAAILRLDGEARQETVNRKKQLNLLILGAGSHGHSVRETAEKLGVFQEIRFLDDAVTGPDILGTCEEYQQFLDRFPAMFPAFGNNELRRSWVKKLREAGALLPRLIHPDTTISQRVTIADGTVILSQATVNAGASIGEGCIVAANVIVGYDARVNDFVHLDSGVILQKNAEVAPMTTVDSGEIVRPVTA